MLLIRCMISLWTSAVSVLVIIWYFCSSPLMRCNENTASKLMYRVAHNYGDTMLASASSIYFELDGIPGSARKLYYPGHFTLVWLGYEFIHSKCSSFR
ncbi:hypothetical protein Y032_0241g3373 [Ancylostoma ceylanicum]|uniref:Uncharacterized protein n=1 Tax=Ancylostoma ceylanicum TaxID=53326 RepID=A0A016SEH5_9BILA|nr:hypothetical protein Y032_0241g3373 [Ancylostoma ceylanicum]